MDRPVKELTTSREAPAVPGRFSFDTRIVLLSLLAGSPAFLFAMVLLWTGGAAAQTKGLATAGLGILWFSLTAVLRERLLRPIQTLSNVLAALREGDFSIRTRVNVDSDDPLSLAFHEANQLEAVLREQRLGAVEATALLQRVLEEIDVAVFAFDEDERLRLMNRAGERLLGQASGNVLGQLASTLKLQGALKGPAPRTIEVNLPGGQGRWEVKRTTIRQEGFPLKLLVLSDLSRALREEERLAWKRIIRVLSHEINNSLAPIKSIAGSLRNLLPEEVLPEDVAPDVTGGLKVISGRAESLGRFMASYAQLARLPRPELAEMPVEPWIRRCAALETRVAIEVVPSTDVTIHADADQLDQLLINLIRNAADAVEGTKGGVRVTWRARKSRIHVFVEDDGPGLEETENLFVPFYTTKPGGSGIGLALSQQIAEGHGGTLTLRNRRPQGAVARLTLPVDPEGD
ncbi:MAG: PAS domain-containing protein [Gemmatimonadetes bacterium]|nr:PAS domain-containing protein [Gemmatimonadota bacterium]